MSTDDQDRERNTRLDKNHAETARVEEPPARTEFYVTQDGTAKSIPERRVANAVVLEEGSIRDKLAVLEDIRSSGDTGTVLITAKPSERGEAEEGFKRLNERLVPSERSLESLSGVTRNQDQGKHEEAFIELRLDESGGNYSLQERHAVEISKGAVEIVVDVVIRTRGGGAPVAPAEVKAKTSDRITSRERTQAEGLVSLAKEMPCKTVLRLTYDGQSDKIVERLSASEKDLVVLEKGTMEEKMQTLEQMRVAGDMRPVIMMGRHDEVGAAQHGLEQLHHSLNPTEAISEGGIGPASTQGSAAGPKSMHGSAAETQPTGEGSQAGKAQGTVSTSLIGPMDSFFSGSENV